MIAKPITGKTVVVTGGSRGIGLGLVKKFLSRDNTVIATSRNGAEATHLHQLHKEYPSKLHITDLDTAVPSSIVDWAEGVKRTGISHVDVLINNAGVYGRRPSLAEFTEEDFLFAFRPNAIGPFLVVQQLLKQDLLGIVPVPAPAAAPPASGEAPQPPPLPAPTTLVANMSSIVGSNTEPTVSAVMTGGFAYRASKAALNVISTTMARDLAPRGIEVVVLHPGYVRTDLSGGLGWIDVDQSANGLVSVLESGQPLNGRFLSYDGKEIPW